MATKMIFAFTFHTTLTLDAAAAIRMVTGMHIAGFDDPTKDTPGQGRLGDRVLIFLERGDPEQGGDERAAWTIEAYAAVDAVLDYPRLLGIRDNLRTLLKQLDSGMTETNYPDLTTAERANPATHYLLHGKVRCYKTEKHYGFLTTVDGFKLYFRREVVEGNIVSLTSGREIEFSVRLGHKGPEAATVRVAWEHAPSGGGPAQLAELDATTAPYLFATSSTQGFAPHGIATRDASFTHPGTIKPPH